MTTYVEMSGKPPPVVDQQVLRRHSEVPGEDAGSVKILKVCFISNSSNLGKNFKLVKCDSSWEIRVSVAVLHTEIFLYIILNNAVYDCTVTHDG